MFLIYSVKENKMYVIPILANFSGVLPLAINHLHQFIVSLSPISLLGFNSSSNNLVRDGGQPLS